MFKLDKRVKKEKKNQNKDKLSQLNFTLNLSGVVDAVGSVCCVRFDILSTDIQWIYLNLRIVFFSAMCLYLSSVYKSKLIEKMSKDLLRANPSKTKHQLHSIQGYTDGHILVQSKQIT